MQAKRIHNRGRYPGGQDQGHPKNTYITLCFICYGPVFHKVNVLDQIRILVICLEPN